MAPGGGLDCNRFYLTVHHPCNEALVQENARQMPAAANGLFMMISFMARSATPVREHFVPDRNEAQEHYMKL